MALMKLLKLNSGDLPLSVRPVGETALGLFIPFVETASRYWSHPCKSCRLNTLYEDVASQLLDTLLCFIGKLLILHNFNSI